ncbi:methyltransferase domain-containing protein [Undibacterium sp. RTI2.1]|uniref:spermine/spermidine synthase domain-containing protein n=1 Tax=unclassified Undibacterium TaxID=2630295 RepID=UPI002AB5612C|nr:MULTISPECIES: methyltransferase domain-containing protein [unclassified Undibacterium]MDY7536896.1 methyltransferase domain-containing protein [Undibacterium sp. 5I1]MEB0031674.1 methyltransferase domain-containing protein [Undibacterium sp. RTI2.1]MEB0117945.1 methyltransferase domain-containing protein [Undibacterium sp. RTI2.2]MEB0230401.1 methyltransferase domain-containing protein [Undibacterium sp. 10I3]MEB0258819.1 methyltransferase domain-containing protein [Undibacterium sp. 5I1]
MLIKRKSIEAEANYRSGPRAAGSTAQKPARKAKFAPITLSELDGVRYLHFGTEWVQGAMRLRKPDWLELEYAQQMMAWMLFATDPKYIVQLGLGTGALTKFCYRQFPMARITAVDLNPAVIAICESMFKLPANDERLHVVEMDALDFVNDPSNEGQIDIMQVDLYDATAKGPVLDTAEFYEACAACLTPNGLLTVNLFGDHPSYAKNLKALRFVFDRVLCLPEVHDGNVVAIAFKSAIKLDFPVLYERAAIIKEISKLPAKSWVDGLKETTKSA